MSGSGPAPGGTWPANELEETLQAAVGNPEAGPRLIEVLARSSLWVPLPEGGGPQSPNLDLPTLEIEGGVYVPVFSSVAEFHTAAGSHLSFAVAPGQEFVRGLPPQVGIVVNPGGTIGAPVPAPAVAEICRVELDGLTTGRPRGARMRLFEPDWQQEPVGFLGSVAGELAVLGYVRSARRGLTSAEGGAPSLCVGVEVDAIEHRTHGELQQALGRALALHPVAWPVQLVLMDAAEDPLIDWLRTCITPFHRREDQFAADGGHGL
ncbi:enhanced serine sensitivity protein SseB C-terminal domain-containing protein [Streptomyces lonarensis]|uniref:Enhanced serine sensitivity protein SseB n=1 Tax=Streptomyces lonarensis TaxID=700599 RepID=A0A7X6D0Z1_9ACTN|nr:enhanced serine sensitivity protein SseB C-terminal domain-containing protein [Streptomyces lonarensis]NJQ06216.1 enhanced serine sensitivity protein SseB [Streptomyces lonarensis]